MSELAWIDGCLQPVPPSSETLAAMRQSAMRTEFVKAAMQGLCASLFEQGDYDTDASGWKNECHWIGEMAVRVADATLEKLKNL